jgi:gamma-glutamyl hercynylcysteine S-oxide synthase
MYTAVSQTFPWTIVLMGFFNLCFGFCIGNSALTAGGAAAFAYGLTRGSRRAGSNELSGKPAKKSPAAPANWHPPAPRASVDPSDTEGLVRQMLDQGRYALLLRPQLAESLGEMLFLKTIQTLEQNMALVPDGEVLLGRAAEGEENPDDPPPAPRVVRVDCFFLDRYPVTNRQYYEFISSGGYQQMPLWDESVWLAVLDFVDRTGKPGPRYWRDGCYGPGEDNHPVVGVCWYEASAYARWSGKRLPSDAEWVKAGSWPVPACSQTLAQRRYPWGETMDRSRANLWGSGADRVVAVDEFAGGVSVGGVYQLIGNVWEWTCASYRGADHPAGALIPQTDLKSIRGGAFDTYFDNQATCQFQSGEHPLHRRHNIGFRCAVGVCDLQLALPQRPPEQRSAEETDSAPDEGEPPIEEAADE